MGQQPNIELEISDLPRPRKRPDPARSWVPDRPGELHRPEDMQWGAGFGTTGPDSGYARSLVAARDLVLADGEHRSNVDVAVAAIASARSSLFGRAPTGKDIEMVLVLLGYDNEGVPAEMTADLAAKRVNWFAAAGHHPANLHSFIALLSADTLRLTAGEARSQMAQGTALITH
ncbi:MAG: hypothetical protein GY926_24095 [bacterium]|nr:hypothetical protein [bacterium]